MLILSRERVAPVGVTLGRPVFLPHELTSCEVKTWMDFGDPRFLNAGPYSPRSGRRAICRDNQLVSFSTPTKHIRPNHLAAQGGYASGGYETSPWIWREKSAIATAQERFTWKYGCVENQPSADVDTLMGGVNGSVGFSVRYPFVPQLTRGASFYFLYAVPDLSSEPATGFDGIVWFAYRPAPTSNAFFFNPSILTSSNGTNRFSQTRLSVAEGNPDVSAAIPGSSPGVRPATPNKPILLRVSFDGLRRSEGGGVWLYSQHTGVSTRYNLAAECLAEPFDAGASARAKALVREDTYRFVCRLKSAGTDQRAWMRMFECIWVEHSQRGPAGMISQQDDLRIRRYLQDAWGFDFTVPVTDTQVDANLPA